LRKPSNLESIRSRLRSFLLDYGLKQYLSDGAAVPQAAGDDTTRNELKAGGVKSRITKVLAGECAIRANSAEPKDPAERHRQAVIMEILRSIADAKGVKLPKRTGPKADPERLDAMMKKVYEAKRDIIEKEVAKRMASKMDLGEIDLDL
jgi:hypothetical protein